MANDNNRRGGGLEHSGGGLGDLVFAGLPLLALLLALAMLLHAAANVSGKPKVEAAAAGGFSRLSMSDAGRWLPLPGPATIMRRIAFGSCLDQRRPQPIWNAVIAARPQLFLMTGDNVYGDIRDGRMDRLEQAYAQQLAHPEFAAARAKIPFLATWDDHDYGLNDGGAEFPQKAQAAKLFHDFWQMKRPRQAGEGVYHSTIIGPPGQRVQVIMLDMRSFRSPLSVNSKDERKAARAAGRQLGRYGVYGKPDRTQLGAAQWAWLAQELARPAELRILVSSIQFLATTHGWERWGELAAERQRLLDLIAKSNVKGVIVVSGDRHRGAFYKYDKGLAYPLIEITSSALNMSFNGDDGPDPARLGGMYGRDNFGMIDVDWKARTLRVALYGVGGERMAGLDLDFTDLGLR